MIVRTILLLVLSLLLASVGLEKEIWADEAHSLWFHSTQWSRLLDNTLPPLYFFFGGLVNPRAEPPVARLWSLAIFCVGLLAFCFHTRRLKSSAFFVGGIFLVCNPIILRHAVEIRCYGLVVTLTLCALALISEGVQSSKGGLWSLLVLLFLLPMTHPIGLPAAGAVVATWWCLRPKGVPVKHLIAGLTISALSCLTWYLTFDKASSGGGDWIPKPTFHRVCNKILQVVLGKTDVAYWCPIPGGYLSAYLSALGFGLLLTGLLFVNFRAFPRGGGLPYLAGALSLFAQLVFVTVTVQSLLMPRFFIGLVPFLALYLAYQVEVSESRSLALVIAILSGALFSYRWFGWEGRRSEEAWAGLVSTVQREASPETDIIVSSGITTYIARHYFKEWPVDRCVDFNEAEYDLEMLPSGPVYLLYRKSDHSRTADLRAELQATFEEEQIDSTSTGTLFRYRP